ncbi:MAG: glycine C-acetyltransferase [Planctomycetaceae bacterium]|jgi:glycine C-acetyltransferase|nr:glycine C-acetyltransferase [Planctomycetaceae bacterium]MCE2813208.1 glycine C-acetyltransferase [Planctomycetaceae bacterium]
MNAQFLEHLASSNESMRQAGTFKRERVIDSAQGTMVRLADGKEYLNLCANNYLGLAQHPEVRQAADDALARWGYGMASVRFICGTQTIHKQLEDQLSQFLGFEDTILYNSCWDANGGLFETILGPEDAIISDELNHASIIDGIRLCKAQRFRYKNSSMEDLRAKLQEAKSARFRLIATDGVFSMDGTIADLASICQLADEYDALVMVDDSHAVGFVGPKGRGSHEHCGVMDRIDIMTGTLGKALGGASGGYTSGKAEMVELLRQRSRTYLFSNTIAPPVVAGAIRALELLQGSTQLRDRLESNTAFFRTEMKRRGLNILDGVHPIVPVMIGDASLAGKVAQSMLAEGIYVIGFSYPVVPQGKARIRTQVSAAHSTEQLAQAASAFERSIQQA